MKIMFKSDLLLYFSKVAKDVKVNKGFICDKIYVEASKRHGGEVRFSKTNIDEQITMNIQCEVYEEGRVEIPLNTIDLIKKDKFIEINNNGILQDNRNIKLDLSEKGDFDFLLNKNFIDEYNIFELDDKEIKQLLEVTHALSEDDTKKILTGIRIIEDEFVAIDGYRLSTRKGNFNSDIEVSFPKYKVLEKMKGTIIATACDKIIKFTNGTYEYYSQTIDGTFIDYKKLITSNYDISIKLLNRSEVIDSLKTFKKISKESRNKLVLVTIGDSTLKIINQNSDVKIEDTFELKDCIYREYYTSENPFYMGFNCQYLEEALSSMSDDCLLKFTSNVNPLIIENYKGKELLLPVRITIDTYESMIS